MPIMNYNSSLIKFKWLEIEEIPAVEYTAISLHERFSKPGIGRCLPSCSTRWKNPRKRVRRTYFTNHSGGLSERFTSLNNNSTLSDIDDCSESMGNTQWWTTSCQWVRISAEHIYSSLLSVNKQLPERYYKQSSGNPAMIHRNYPRRIFLRNSLVKISNCRSVCGDETYSSSSRQVSKKHFSNDMPYSGKWAEKRLKDAHLRQQLDDELGDYMRNLQIKEPES